MNAMFISRIKLLAPITALFVSLGLGLILAQPTYSQANICEGATGSFNETTQRCTPDDMNQGELFDTDNDGESIFTEIADLLLFLVGAISVIMLIIGGIRYVVSAGDPQAVTNAKNTILYAIVGIIVSFLAFAAVRFVAGRLASG